MTNYIAKAAEVVAAVVPPFNFIPSAYNLIDGGIKLSKANTDDANYKKNTRETKTAVLGKAILIDKAKSDATWQIIRGACEIVPIFGIAAYGIGVLAYNIITSCFPKKEKQYGLLDLGDDVASKIPSDVASKIPSDMGLSDNERLSFEILDEEPVTEVKEPEFTEKDLPSLEIPKEEPKVKEPEFTEKDLPSLDIPPEEPKVKESSFTEKDLPSLDVPKE